MHAASSANEPLPPVQVEGRDPAAAVLFFFSELSSVSRHKTESWWTRVTDGCIKAPPDTGI